MSAANKNPYLAALAWHLDAGADEAVQDTPNDRTAAFHAHVESIASAEPASGGGPALVADVPQGRVEAARHAIEAAFACRTLDELRQAIASYDGLAIRRTAANLVFAAGNPYARVMAIGDAPSADDDRQGEAFSGPAGVLVDRVFGSIGLSRETDVYLTNLLNWRPPGNRTPSPAEIELSLPFLERHIALAQPKILILLGGTVAGALLGGGEAISRLRGKVHLYAGRSDKSQKTSPIPAIVTYHPVALLNNPSHKKHAWQDMLATRTALFEIT